jgi:hypothetical protein
MDFVLTSIVTVQYKNRVIRLYKHEDRIPKMAFFSDAN